MNLDRLLKPASVAVIGVSSQNNRHPANVIYKKIRQRRSIRVYAVNPRGGTLQEDKIYETLSAVPEPVDAVIVAARAAYVPDLIEECIRCKAGGAIVISGGFAEVGNQAAQDYIATVAIAAGFPMIGPNCLGNYAPGIIDTLFTPPERMERPQAGGVAFVSQSGGFLLDLLSKFANSRIGISQAVSIGNKAVVREIDLLRYFDRDPDTRVIAFYIEGFGENEGENLSWQPAIAANRWLCIKLEKAGRVPGLFPATRPPSREIIAFFQKS
jgi:acyl-CoA synthetase (NDP forming)